MNSKDPDSGKDSLLLSSLLLLTTHSLLLTFHFFFYMPKLSRNNFCFFNEFSPTYFYIALAAGYVSGPCVGFLVEVSLLFPSSFVEVLH